MAKGTRIELKPDDPIFTQGPQIFVSVSRPSTDASTKSTDGGNDMKDATPFMKKTIKKEYDYEQINTTGTGSTLSKSVI